MQKNITLSLTEKCRQGCDLPQNTWQKFGNILVRGYVYIGNNIVSGYDFANLFKGVENIDELSQVLEGLNGYFAVVIVCDQAILAAVDRICSTPIFYSVDVDVVIGDGLTGFTKGQSRLDYAGVHQYLSAGYTFGKRTILENVRSLLAGEACQISLIDGWVQSRRYFRYIQENTQGNKSSSELLEELHKVHLKVFERMVASLGGRQAVVPLTAGYDSRLIVEMLARFEHRNVLCVTWGDENFHEVRIARDVAENLGFPWVRDVNSAKDWWDWRRAGNMSLEIEACGALSNIPYIQDNITVQNLKIKKKIESDAVFLSGNSGDFIEGGHIFESADSCDVEGLLAKLERQHAKLIPVKDRNVVLDSIRGSMDGYISAQGTLDGFDEAWEWENRQSKYVSKSIKPFEVIGHEWRMPFWDLEIMKFWASVPRRKKANRKLFYQYAQKYMDCTLPTGNPERSIIRRYYDVLTNGRFGLFLYERPLIGRLDTTRRFVRNEVIRSFLRHRPIGATRLLGLVCLATLDRVLILDSGR